MSIYKMCRKCGSTKAICEFSKNKTMVDGVQSWCKECARAASALRHASKKQARKPQSVNQLLDVSKLLSEALEAILSDWDYCGSPSLEGVIGTRQLVKAREALETYKREATK